MFIVDSLRTGYQNSTKFWSRTEKGFGGTSYIHNFSGAPRGAFQQPVYNKCKVRGLRVLARPLQAVHNVFLSETLSCALS